MAGSKLQETVLRFMKVHIGVQNIGTEREHFCFPGGYMNKVPANAMQSSFQAPIKPSYPPKTE